MNAFVALAWAEAEPLVDWGHFANLFGVQVAAYLVGSIRFALALAVAYLAWIPGDGAWTKPELARSVFVLAAAILVVVRHAPNIRRILAGTEGRISLPWTRRPAAPPPSVESPAER